MRDDDETTVSPTCRRLAAVGTGLVLLALVAVFFYKHWLAFKTY